MNEYRAAIYCRLSKEDEEKINKGDDSESIQNQKLLLMDYAITKGWSVHRIYSDDDRKGFDRDRPEFNRLLMDAENNRFNLVLCKSLSRFTRDMEIVEKYIHGTFGLWGIRFVGVVDHVDTLVKGNKKARQINGLVNEWYSEDLSENIKAVFKNKMKDGLYLGSFAPYGYIKSPENRHKLIIDDEAAGIVREIFKLYLQGYGCKQICDILAGRGVPTPSAYKKQRGLKFQTPNSGRYSEQYGAWARNSVLKILQNKAYIGFLIQGRERKVSYKSKKIVIAPKDEWIIIKNAHPPIIEEKTFYTVQSLLSNKRNTHKPVSGIYKGTESAHILAGKIVCCNCGSSLHRGATGRNGTRYLRCKLYKKTNGGQCTPHSVKLDEVTNMVEQKIKTLIQDYVSEDINLKLVGEVFNNINNTQKLISTKEREITKCESKIQDAVRVMTAAYVDKAKGIISEMDFINIKEVLDVDSETQKIKKARLKDEITELYIKLKSVVNVEEALEKYLDFNFLTHDIVNDFIESIQVSEKDKNGEQDVIINWLF